MAGLRHSNLFQGVSQNYSNYALGLSLAVLGRCGVKVNKADIAV